MISAYIMPHPPAAIKEVGFEDIFQMESTINSYRNASERIAEDALETIVVISPHAPMFRDGFYIAEKTWRAQGLHRDLPAINGFSC